MSVYVRFKRLSELSCCLFVVGFEYGGELCFGWLGDPVEGSTVVRVAVGFDDDVASVDSLKDPSFTGGGV